MIKDRRLTRDVDDTRCVCNLKPFRDKRGKADARRYARKDSDGAIRSTYSTRVRFCECGARDKRNSLYAKYRRKGMAHVETEGQ